MHQVHEYNPFGSGITYSATRSAQFAEENGGPGLPMGMQDFSDLNLSDEQREALTGKVQEWNKGVQSEFQKRAESLKQWEPYQQIGVHEVEPDELADLLELREVLSDQDRLKAWHKALGEQLGLNQQQQQQLEQQAPQGLTEEKMKEMFATMLDERLNPFQQKFQQQEESERVQQARQQIDTDIQTIDPESKLTDEQKNYVCQLALAYADPESGDTGIAKGFADYQKLIGATEQEMFNNKANQPNVPVKPGGPPTAQAPITTYTDAKAAALERIRQSNAT